jgi:hypothetical protein
MPPQDLPDFAKLGASLLGSLVSLKFVAGTAIERGLMFVGGASLSYYSTSPLAEWIGGKGLEGLIGFFTGLLGMTVVAKVYEVISVVDAKEVGSEIVAWAKRKWGA